MDTVVRPRGCASRRGRLVRAERPKAAFVAVYLQRRPAAEAFIHEHDNPESMSKYDHFEKYEWIGLFWAESDCIEKETPIESESYIDFPGKLSYDIENGVQLEFMCPMGRRIKKSRHIYGALENGEKCTLFGNFDPDRFGFHSGEISIYKAKITFESVVFGIHITTEEKFDGISMDFTNFQEFCHPQGFRDWAQYSEEPIFKESHEDIEISL